MVKKRGLPRPFTDAVVGATGPMAGATRQNLAGPDFGPLVWASLVFWLWGGLDSICLVILLVSLTCIIL